MGTSGIGMNRRETPIALTLLGVGLLCVSLSLLANPAALGRFVQAPTPHLVYFFVGAAVMFLSSRVMILERRLRSLKEPTKGASDSRVPPNTSLERSRER